MHPWASIFKRSGAAPTVSPGAGVPTRPVVRQAGLRSLIPVTTALHHASAGCWARDVAPLLLAMRLRPWATRLCPHGVRCLRQLRGHGRLSWGCPRHRGFCEVVLFSEWRFSSRLFSVLVPRTRLSNVGEIIISAGTNDENPASALVSHRRKKELGGWVSVHAFSLAFPTLKVQFRGGGEVWWQRWSLQMLTRIEMVKMPLQFRVVEVHLVLVLCF